MSKVNQAEAFARFQQLPSYKAVSSEKIALLRSLSEKLNADKEEAKQLLEQEIQEAEKRAKVRANIAFDEFDIGFSAIVKEVAAEMGVSEDQIAIAEFNLESGEVVGGAAIISETGTLNNELSKACNCPKCAAANIMEKIKGGATTGEVAAAFQEVLAKAFGGIAEVSVSPATPEEVAEFVQSKNEVKH